MRGKSRAAQLAGVSALAIMASLTLVPTPAVACEAVANVTGGETNFVTVTCVDDPNVASREFALSHQPRSGSIGFFDYDGSGNDFVTVEGGALTPFVAGVPSHAPGFG